MPHRILTHPVSIAIEAMFIGFVAAWHGCVAVTEFISEKDWGRLLGEDGFKAALLIGLAAVWCRSEKGKEQRHTEMVSALAARDRKDDARIEQFIQLSAETIKGQAKLTGAIQAFDSNAQRVYVQLSELTEKINQCHNCPHPTHNHQP